MEISGYKVQILGGHHFSKSSKESDHIFTSSSIGGLHPWFPEATLRGKQLASKRWFPSMDSFNSKRDYVEMKDKTYYKIKMTNNHNTRCTAKVNIDGKSVGKWVINPFSSIVIERPVDMDKKFTFFRKSSEGFVTARLKAGDPKNGLIQVEFTPENDEPTFSSYWPESLEYIHNGTKSSNYSDYQLRSDSVMPQSFLSRNACQSFLSADNRNCFLGTDDADYLSRSSSKYEEGGTALRGKSHQKFRHVNIGKLDPSRRVKISVRLVARRYSDSDLDLDYSLRSNPVPPPIQ